MLTICHGTNNIRPLFRKLKQLNKTFYSIFYRSVHNKNFDNQLQQIPKNGPWKVLFFGTDEFAVESLKVLHSKYQSKVLQRLEVVTLNLKNNENTVTKFAKQNNIVVNNWPLQVEKHEFHIGIVVSFGRLIPSNVINAFPLGILNVHGSLLPRWRGAAPLTYTLMNGDSKAGVTIMRIMPKKFDIGEILLQRHIDIDEHETMPQLYTKLSVLGAQLLTETFENLLEFLQNAKPQDESKATYAPKITSKISLIDWNQMSAKNVYNLHRALLGLYALSTTYENVKIKLFDVQCFQQESITTKLEKDVPGTVIYNRRLNRLIIKCKDQSFVSVKNVIVQGKRCMSALDFYNGYMCGQGKTKIFFS